MRKRWCALAAMLAVTAACAAAPASAQDELRGEVVLQGRPLPGQEVVLHRVRADIAGPMARTRADRQGRFRFRLPPRDTGAFTVYLVTTEYQGVRYIGPPVHPDDRPAAYRVVVYDTAVVPGSTSPVRLQRRDLILNPHPAGGWEVHELLVLRNPAPRTWLAGDWPVWSLRLPDRAAHFEVAEADFDANRVRRVGRYAAVLAPITPGFHQLLLRYRWPARTGRIRIEPRADTLRLFLRLPVRPPQDWPPGDTVNVDGDRFLRVVWVPAPAALALPGGAPPLDPRWPAVAVASATLLLGAWAALRRRPCERPSCRC